MKLECKVKLSGIEYEKIGYIEIDESKLVGLLGFAPRNYLYNKVDEWVGKQIFWDFKIIEGYEEDELPYYDEPYKLK